MNPAKTSKNIISGIKKYFRENGFNKAVLGLSGGLDSAVCLALTVKALGNKNVAAIIMPEFGVTLGQNVKDARKLAKKLKVRHYIGPINACTKCFRALPWKQNRLADINIKARVRANILYNFANSKKALVIGTSNKSEIKMGYGTKYGDLTCDLFVIADLYKTEVIELAEYLKIPKDIVEKIPSAELYIGQKDEEELGITYELLDEILKLIDKGNKEKDLLKKRYAKKYVDLVFKRIKENRHKCVLPKTIQS